MLLGVQRAVFWRAGGIAIIGRTELVSRAKHIVIQGASTLARTFVPTTAEPLALVDVLIAFNSVLGLAPMVVVINVMGVVASLVRFFVQATVPLTAVRAVVLGVIIPALVDVYPTVLMAVKVAAI